MPKTRINCPNCRQPVTADVEQLFDVGIDPTAKQRLLSGASNVIKCPSCGYQGAFTTALVYHDPDKELLLTYVPAEMGLPRNEQERLVGSLINQAVSKLPQEKRKAYIFQPQTMLTMQGLVERILQADGITKEMLQAQQQRLGLLQRLAGITDKEARAQVIQQEDKLIDGDFFSLFNRLAESSMAVGDQESIKQLNELQDSLLANSTFGKTLKAQSDEIQTAMKDLQALGKDLTQEKLLDLLVAAPNEVRLAAITSLVRPALDYAFFQMLSDRIDRARTDGRARLVELREKLLELTSQIDKQTEARRQQARELLNTILKAKDVREGAIQNLGGVDDFFLKELNAAMEAARKSGDLEQVGKLQKIIDVIQEATTPPEMAFIQELLEAPDDAARNKLLETYADELTPEFMSALASLATQAQSGEDKEIAEAIARLNRQVLRFSMQRNLKK